MTRRTLPGAEEKAIEILGCIIEGHWEDARRDFGEKMLEAVSADRACCCARHRRDQAIGECE